MSTPSDPATAVKKERVAVSNRRTADRNSHPLLPPRASWRRQTGAHVFLASNEASYITAEFYGVTGGDHTF